MKKKYIFSHIIENNNYKFYRFVTQGVQDETGLMCRHDGEGAEDVELGKCMENLHVQAGDSRDSLGRGRFFPFVPEHHLIPGLVGKDFWYWKYIYYPTEEVSTILTLWYYEWWINVTLHYLIAA